MRITAAVPVEAFRALPERIADALRPETMRVIEENLRTIDLAIAQADSALSRDPGRKRGWVKIGLCGS